MKTCIHCGNEYNYLSPLSVVHGKFESDPNVPVLHRANSFCSPACWKIYIDAQEVKSNEYYLGKMPLERLEMCQFCGNFNHPTEYCRQENMEETFKAHQEIDNKTGELINVKGDLVYVKHGQHVQLTLEKVVFKSTMKKLPADIETRIPLFYFWHDDDACKEVLDPTNGKEVDITKYITTNIKPTFVINASRKIEAFMCYHAKKIQNPQKIFFPFDIRQENCWWPIQQSFSCIESTNLDETEIDKDYTCLFEYEEEEEQEDEEMKITEEEMGKLTIL